MIEKLKKKQTKFGYLSEVSPLDILDKINELVDVVNDITDWVKRTDETIVKYGIKPIENTTFSKMEFVDPYAEQRKWIGKLCRFWDDDAFITSNDWAFGILTSIDKGMQYQYCCNENCNFKHCEPVKPDDDIIYNGERDENK